VSRKAARGRFIAARQQKRRMATGKTVDIGKDQGPIGVDDPQAYLGIFFQGRTTDPSVQRAIR